MASRTNEDGSPRHKRPRYDDSDDDENTPMGEIVMVNVTGRDRVGITREVTTVLTKHQVEIMDLNQTVSQKKLMLGIVIRTPHGLDTSAMKKDLLFATFDMGLQVDITTIPHVEYEDWVGMQGQPQWILTLLARELKAEYLSAVTELLSKAQLNIATITRLSGRKSLFSRAGRATRACVEIRLRGEVNDEAALKDQIMKLCSNMSMDLSFQKDDIFRRYRRLAVFDMDSTLIQCEVIDELAREAGVYEEVAAITESAMRGEIDFGESLKQRVEKLKGLPESTLQVVAERLPLTEGARRLIRTLRRMGYKTAILSGGFTYFAHHLQKILGFDFVHANQLEIENGIMTGRVTGTVVDANQKATYLKEIAKNEGIDMRQTMAVGDGANDLPMLSIAGLGVAFHAKPLVRKQAKHQISTLGLDGVLYLIGVSDRDVKMIQTDAHGYFSE
uniref:phosphoserine phosphatase n=1 Tax=Eutreptiella gymnastica TaxID=73025 RepID=A0A7S1IM89_9EUGL